MQKRWWELRQDFAKAEERKLPGDRLVRRRRRRKRELTCFKCVQKFRKRAYGAKLKPGQLFPGTSGDLGALGAYTKDTHTPWQLVAKSQCSGGCPVQDWTELIKTRGKEEKNKIKNWENSRAEVIVMSSITVKWQRLNKTTWGMNDLGEVKTHWKM